MDPIIAPVTRLVPQPVGIIRISGENSWSRSRSFFPDLPDILEHRKVYFTRPVFQNSLMDECLLIYFQSPHSFTGEEVLEIHAHGNPHHIRALLEIFQRHGFRLAKPGEFTLRAYHNKKISLLKAESLHRMIQAPSYGQFLSSHQHFSNETLHPLFKFQQEYLDLIAQFFMILDHPESEETMSNSLSRDSLIAQFKSLITHGSRVSNEYRKKRRFFNGFTILLAGFPNSGKSSLFNRLLKDNRAIVSPVPGTTRDLVEGRLTFSSGDVILLDSAGLRPTKEAIELEGIQKTRKMLHQADCIFWISSPDYPDEDSFLTNMNLKTKILRLWNKADLSLPSRSLTDFDHVVSARTRKGLPSLVKHIERLSEDFYRSSLTSESDSLDSDRQLQVLSNVLHLIKPVPGFLTTNHFDLALHSLEEGRKVLDDGVGLIPASDIYDRVFRMFCLGK